jgi:DNA-binding response OmpR family regulator
VGPTVLIVDDDRRIVDVLTELLTEEGFGVRRAYDGQMAIEAVDRGAADLVVTDVRMPRLDGIDLARRLRDRPQPIPVVLIGAVQTPIEIPGVPFLRKPFDIEHLVAIVRRLLSRARAGNGAGEPDAP